MAFLRADRLAPPAEWRVGYYEIKFLGNHFVRYWDGSNWHFAKGGPPTPLNISERTEIRWLIQDDA